MTPEEIAELKLSQAQQRLLLRKERREIEQKIEENSGRYQGYDADAEQHYTFPNKPIKQLLTNAGLAQGDPLELVDGNADAMPRRRPRPRRRPITPDPEPLYGVLLKRRAYLSTGSDYVPPKGDEYSDPVPALFSMVYYSASFQGGAVAFWNPSYQKRYCEGGSLELCGRDFGNPLSNLDRDPYCRDFPVSWLAIPDENFQSLGLPGRRCHYAIAIENEEGVRGLVGGLIIACLAPATDGESEPPVTPPFSFPTVNYKVINPLYPSGTGYPPGERYLACSVEQGASVNMAWTQLEVIQVSDYVPPQLISPASPGGTYPYNVYESQYWLITAQGAVKVATVPDVLYPPEDRPIGQGSTERNTSAYLSADENGTIHLDLKISSPNFETGTFTISLEHYQIQGLAVAEVEQSQSWRQKFTNSLTDTPLPGTPLHPCADSYQIAPSVNIALQAGRLIQSPPFYTMTDLREGKALSFQIWQLPGGAVCELPLEPQETKDVQITAFENGMIETSPQDAAPISLVGVIGYV